MWQVRCSSKVYNTSWGFQREKRAFRRLLYPWAWGTSARGLAHQDGREWGVQMGGDGAGWTLVRGPTSPSQGTGGALGCSGRRGRGDGRGKAPQPGFFEEGDEGAGTKSPQVLLPTASAATRPVCPRPHGHLTGRRRGADSTRPRKSDGEEGEAGCNPRSKLIINKRNALGLH